jgi:chromosome partitioning protein
VDTTLQVMALGVARWLLVPTKADASSIRGLQRVAERVVDAGTTGHRVDVLGLVLTGVPTAATRVRARPRRRRHHYRAGRQRPLLGLVVRSSDAVARECRARGPARPGAGRAAGRGGAVLAGLPGRPYPHRLPGSAPALADDYVGVTEQVLLRLNELQASRGAA